MSYVIVQNNAIVFDHFQESVTIILPIAEYALNCTILAPAGNLILKIQVFIFKMIYTAE